MTEKFIKIPVFSKFGDDVPIGELKISKSALPPTPDFCFSLGYRKLDSEKDSDYELLNCAIQPDELYLRYLKVKKFVNS